MSTFLYRPQSTRLRKLLFQIHLWTGLGVGLYLVLIGVTGAALVFRQDMQAAKYPQFFRPETGSLGLRSEDLADASAVLRGLGAAYPGYRVSGLDWPTYRRGTFLAYVARGAEFTTVFAHPVSGRVTGELPVDGIRWLQELHFNLLGGSTGLVVNGIGAACLLAMCLTGVVIWWPGLARWTQGLRVDLGKGWRRVVWELHGAVGVWLWALLAMWAVTGVYFAFSQPFRNLVNAMAPLTVVRAPESDPAHAGRPGAAWSADGGLQASAAPAVRPEALIARAQAAVPGARVARFVLPFDERGTFLVVMARATHGDYDTSDEVSMYFDQYSGELLLTRDHGQRTAGDTLLAWVGPLHVGSFGGLPVKIAWALFGLALPLLFVTGALMWWNRI